jgi:Uma2 family endonuclease
MGASRPDLQFTYDDYKTLSASTDERHELIDGDLYRVPAPTVAHQVVSKNLALRLEQAASATGCGRLLYAPLDVVLGEGEMRSVKKSLYARSGVREYWLVDPKLAVIEVLSLGRAGYDAPLRYDLRDRVISKVVPSFEIALSDVLKNT